MLNYSPDANNLNNFIAKPHPFTENGGRKSRANTRRLKAVSGVCLTFGVQNLNQQQKKALAEFLSGSDVFVNLRRKRLGGKRGAGIPGYGVPGCGKCGVWWKTQGPVENAGSGGKRGVRWKTRGPVENAGSGGKRGVWWKMRGLVENAGSGGKRGVWWKTRGLVENAGSNVENTGNHYFSPQYALSPLK